ncbi:unnamed protein product [Closterium sp. NIES-53]
MNMGAARDVASKDASSRGAAFVGAEPASAEPGGAELEGAELGGAESEGAESGGAERKGAEPGGTESEGAEPEGAESEGAESGGAAGAGGSVAGGARATSLGGAGVTAGAGGTGGAGAAVLGGAGGTGGARTSARAGGAEAGGAGAGDLGAGGTGNGGAGSGGARAGGAGAGGTGARGAEARGTGAETLELEVLALGVLELAVLVLEALCNGARSSFCCRRRLCRHLTRSFARFLLQPESPLPAPFFYAEQTDSHTERREPESRPALPVCAVRTGRRIPRPCPPPVPGTHIMALRPSSVPVQVPLLSPPASSLPDVPVRRYLLSSLQWVSDPESDLARAASPNVPRLPATVVTDPSFESIAASALVAELVDFAAACRLDYATSLVAESESDSPPSVGGECALGTDVLEDRKEDFECFAAAVPHLMSMLIAPEGDLDALVIPTPCSYAEAIMGPYSSQWQTAMDAEMASTKSTGISVDAVPPPGANIVDGMWIFRVKRPPGSPPAFKARYVARGFSQRQGVNFFLTFSPTTKMTSLRVLLHVATQRDYELHSLDFSTAFLQGSLHEEIWLRPPPGFTGSFPAGTQWSLRRPVYGLCQAPREWHDTLRTTLAALELQKRHACTDLGELRSYLGLQITRDRARRTITLTQSHMVHHVLQRFGFRYSSPHSTPLPSGQSLSVPPSDESVEPSGPYPELVGCLMYLMTCTRPDLAYPLSILARYVAPGRHRPEHWEAAKRVLRYLCSTSGMGLVLGGWGPVVNTGHADASWVDDLATQRSSQGYTFSLGSGFVSWRSTRSSSVFSSSCEAEIYAGAMAAQELRWLTYLLTDLGEQPRSSPVLYVDNKAMIALCQEQYQ